MIVRRPSTADLGGVLALVRAADVAVLGETDWTERDLRDQWETLELERDAWLVELEGRLAGYATFEVRSAVRLMADGYVEPELRGRGVGAALLRLTEVRATEELARLDSAERVYLQNAALLDEGSSTPELFSGHGYAPVRHFWRMAIDLQPGEPAAPAVPPGIRLAVFDRARDARAVYAAQQESFADHWEHRPEPWGEWEKDRLERDRFDPALWLVARAGGDVVGFALNYWKTEGDSGYVESLGVRPGWRRQGLGEALLRASFREFHRRGERRVTLGVDAQNASGATRLYERVGMRILWRAVVYEKEIRPGA